MTARTLLLCANKRLAKQTRIKLAQSGRACQFEVETFTSWTAKLWQQLQWVDPTRPQVLGACAEQLWFLERVRQDTSLPPMTNLAALAQQVHQLWCYRFQYALPESTLKDEAQGWVYCDDFAHWCQAQNVMSSAAVPHAIMEALTLLQVQLPTHIVWLGFLQFTPQEQAFQNKLKDCGVQSTPSLFWDHNEPSAIKAESRAQVQSCASERQEWFAAAHWALARTKKNTSARVAVVVPSLHRCFRQVQWVFEQVLGSTSFNMSGGQPLLAHQSVKLLLLSLKLKAHFSVERLLEWIESAFLNGAQAEAEAEARAKLVLAWHTAMQYPNSLEAAYQDADLIQLCPQLRERLAAVMALPGKTSLAQWLEDLPVFWMGLVEQEKAGAELYEAIACLPELIPFSDSEVALSDMAKRLQFVWQRKLFQTRSHAGARIEVLSLYESIGLEFNAIWFCHADEHQWPLSLQPHPLLPIVLQRTFHLPRACIETEQEYACKVMQAFSQQAKDVVVSFAAYQDDLPQSASHLCQGYPVNSGESIPTLSQLLFEHRPVLHQVEDNEVPALDAVDMAQLTGSSSLLKSMAECPFKGTAEYRLGAQRPPEPVMHLDYRLRGIMLHDVCERVFKANEMIQPSQKASWLERIAEVVRQTLWRHHHRYPRLLPKALLKTEAARLEGLLEQWLEIELERAPFVIRQSEGKLYGTVGGLAFKLRVDRVDETAEGQKIVIDYKTGQVNKNAWFDERPLEPQLPLYAVLTQAQGVCYAQFRPDKLGFNGVSVSDVGVPGVSVLERQKGAQASWGEQLAFWERALTALVTSFTQGHAFIDPKQGAQTCRLCHLRGLCRQRSAG